MLESSCPLVSVTDCKSVFGCGPQDRGAQGSFGEEVDGGFGGDFVRLSMPRSGDGDRSYLRPKLFGGCLQTIN